MIEFKNGNLFEDDAEAVVNTVNCVGVMGRGIALQFKKRFPENFKRYEAACKNKEVVPGKMFVYETGSILNPKYIINFPTKRHWRGASRLEDIDAGLIALVKEIKTRNITSIVIPPLGCGLGGLDWSIVRTRLETALRDLDNVRIDIYQPSGDSCVVGVVNNRPVVNMTPGRAALVGLIKNYLSGLLDPFITLLEIHKLMYFLQESGEQLRLHYVKAPYGPYAENLRHVLNAVEGQLIYGYVDGGDNPHKHIQLVPCAEKEAEDFLKHHNDTCLRIRRVTELVDGFETPFGLELLSTVHWEVVHDGVKGVDEVAQRIYDWNVHKRQFNHRQIDIALKLLSEKGWLE